MFTATSPAGGARAMWWMRLHSAFRTALACTIVGCTTLYGPAYFTEQIRFPAFAYVTAILIVSDDATLGDTVRGCWDAICATIQVMPLAIASLKMIGPSRFSPIIAALAVALTSFLVALPNSTHLLSKRIAFGQIVIVYVGAVVHGRKHHDLNGLMMHPVHVASSTALGAISALLALLLPYPRLAYCEVKKLCQSYAENATERANLYLKASISENQPTAMDLISQAKPLAAMGNKLLRTITVVQEGILWEMPWIRFSKHQFINPGDRFQDMETSMKGMEIALKFCPHLPAGSATQEFTDIILSLLPQLPLKLERATCFLPFNSTTVPEPKVESIDTLIWTYHQMISLESKKLSAFFFLSCVERFLKDSTTRQKPDPISGSHALEREELQGRGQQVLPSGLSKMCRKWISEMKNERLLFASKCSISLGLAVLIGLTFDKENGYWSGLTIAISFATGKQAIFTMATARAHGTAIGSVYGVLGCFVFKKLADIRFVALFPWIIFTSFLRHSRMYGQAGAISADIGALLILGRHNYGPANEFAIARLSEALIGLTSMIFVELLMQPVMASTLAKRHLYLSMGILQECIAQAVQFSGEKDQSCLYLQEFDKKHHHLKFHVHELEMFIEQAELEPNFWFSPFRGGRYRKLHESLLNIIDLLHCMSYNLELVPLVTHNQFEMWKELQKQIDEALKFCNDVLCFSLRGLEKAKILKSYEVAQEVEEGNLFRDLEHGNFQTSNKSTVLTIDDKQIENFESSFLQQLKKATEDIRESAGEAELGRIQALHSLGFGISCFTREIQATYKAIKELIPWELTLR